MGPQNAGQEKLLLITDEVLHKGECIYAEKVILVHFISMQFNLSTSSCVAPQNAGVMDYSMQVYLFSLFLETEHFLKRWYLLTAGYFIATFCAYRQNKRKMDDFLLIFTEILIKICRFIVAMVTKHNPLWPTLNFLRSGWVLLTLCKLSSSCLEAFPKYAMSWLSPPGN